MKTILRGKSKHYTNQEQFDIKNLQEEGNKTAGQMCNKLGYKF